MKPRKKPKDRTKQAQKAPTPSPRNRAIHIPLPFEKAVEGLLNVKPKKKRPAK
jgi:hypothetical protein